MKKVAICIHDLRISEAEKIKPIINQIRQDFGFGKITIHLIVDADFRNEDNAAKFLQSETAEEQLEVVFHGISHQCPPGTGKWFFWYHHNQAEFLSNEFNTAMNTKAYDSMNKLLGMNTGICPPCWIAGRKGWEFLKGLNPLYLESMIYLKQGSKKYLSPVIALGSDQTTDLFFLKITAFLIRTISWISGFHQIRLVIHETDLRIQASMNFFYGSYKVLINKGYKPVLLKEIIS